MAKTPISKPAAKPAARPTPTDRLVEAHEKISALAAENASLKAAAGPAGQRPTTAPGSAPMAPRVPPASTKPGMIEAGVAAALLLFGILAGLAISPQINWGKVVQAPTKVEQPAAPTEEKKTSAEQPAKLADRLDQPAEEPVKVGEEHILLSPAEEQVAQADEPVQEETYAPSAHDVEVMCGWKAGRAAGMLPADRANQFAQCEQPDYWSEQQPTTQLAGMYQQQEQIVPPLQYNRQQPRRGCKIPGSVYVDQLGACILRITDPVAVQKILPDREDDPNCRGKPVGFRYDIRIPPRNGMPAGIAHQVCGVRQ